MILAKTPSKIQRNSYETNELSSWAREVMDFYGPLTRNSEALNTNKSIRK